MYTILTISLQHILAMATYQVPASGRFFVFVFVFYLLIYYPDVFFLFTEYHLPRRSGLWLLGRPVWITMVSTHMCVHHRPPRLTCNIKRGSWKRPLWHLSSVERHHNTFIMSYGLRAGCKSKTQASFESSPLGKGQPRCWTLWQCRGCITT